MDRYLAHHGVKGMKWGVRRYQNRTGLPDANDNEPSKTNINRSLSSRMARRALEKEYRKLLRERMLGNLPDIGKKLIKDMLTDTVKSLKGNAKAVSVGEQILAGILGNKSAILGKSTSATTDDEDDEDDD